MLLRIEDLDRARVKPGALETCLLDLEWLGLDWDEGPYLQSEDIAPMQAAVESLLSSGAAYPCVCSRREIEAALSAPHADGAELPYPGTCADRFTTPEEAQGATGRTPGLRFRVPPGPVAWTDAIHGSMASNVAAEVGDFLIARRDQVFAYQLAVAVDDARQGVTEVLRGADLLTSTPRQMLLQSALGLPSPTWIHVPLVLDADGQRLAKRTPSNTLAELRASGVDPRRVATWAARTSGRPDARTGSAQELIHGFDLAQVSRTPVRLRADALDAP